MPNKNKININDTEESSEKIGGQDKYKITGFGQLGSKKLTLLDLLYSTIIGVLGGIISSLIPFSLLVKVWYPLTGGTQLVSGHHVIWASIVYGLTRKKKNYSLDYDFKRVTRVSVRRSMGFNYFFRQFHGRCLLSGGISFYGKIRRRRDETWMGYRWWIW